MLPLFLFPLLVLSVARQIVFSIHGIFVVAKFNVASWSLLPFRLPLLVQ
jgi:hypothetical protein